MNSLLRTALFVLCMSAWAEKSAFASCTYTQVTAGELNSCALRSDGAIACWGSNWGGQNDPQPGPFARVESAAGRSCGLRTDGSMICWGRDIDPDTTPSGTFIQLGTFDFYVCGLRPDGSIECWGPLGGTPPPGPIPGGTFAQVSTGLSLGVALGFDGTITQFGNGPGGPPAGTFVSVAAGYLHACAMAAADGSVTCWGNSAPAPTGFFTQISSRGHHVCGVQTDQTLACFGTDHPIPPPPPGTFESVSSGSYHNCAVATDGSVSCWGTGSYGDPTVPPAVCAVCGDGIVDTTAEECDDGNLVPGDGCSESCTFDCTAEPRLDCFDAGRSSLRIVDADDDGEDRLLWRWRRGYTKVVDGISAPTDDGRFSICMYPDGGSLAAGTQLPYRSGWSKPSKRYRYADHTQSFGGVRVISLGADGNGFGSDVVEAGGENLPDTLLPATSYTVQLVDGRGNKCWSSTFPQGVSGDGFFKARLF